MSNSTISFTASAKEQLSKIKIDQNLDENYGVRVGVKGGGCSGFTYVLGFDEKKENDNVFDIEGVKVYMDKAHALYLFGIEIDWENGLNNRGFTFNNPNATESCGCGESFSV